MKDILTANDAITSNSKQLEILKTHFPQCFDKTGAFIPAKLQEIVEASGVALSKEGYSLNWLGKSYARLLANENVRTLLKANTEHNNQPENINSQNMLIKGDNLEVLKHLMGAYAGKVKMIYIDPPYNTGSDGFVYHDDRKFTVEQLSHLAGIDEEEARRILEFTDSGSNSHSAWLTFMYPRLYLAKQLLRDDGVIFISIDDNEQAQLKLLMDEIFGEVNHIENFIWDKKNSAKGVPTKNMVVNIHEYVLCYSRSQSTALFGEKRTENTFSNPDNDKRGLWRRSNIKSTLERPIDKFTITDPKTNRQFTNYWAFSKKTLQEMIDEDRILFPKELDGLPKQKEFLNEFANPNMPIKSHLGVFHAQTKLEKEVDAMLGEKVFLYRKPLEFMTKIVSQGGTNHADIYLDFFAGSGTTAHAVMQLNAEDGGNRQFICVQLDEATDPKSDVHKKYKSIYDITAERIKRAAVKIKEAHPEAQCDFGFKQFETIPVFEGYLDAPEDLTPELELFDANQLSAEERHSLMLTWQAQDGIALNTNLTPLDLAGYTAYQGGRLVYFIEPDLTLDAIVAFLERLDNDAAFIPNQLVVLGYLLDSKPQREMTEAVKQYNNRKGIELTLEVRF